MNFWFDTILRGRYIYGGMAEKHQKSGGKPEKVEIFCGKPEKRRVPETEMTFLNKMLKYLRKTVFENCGNQKAVLKSCGKPENTQKTMKSGGNPENREKATETRKHMKFSTESRKQTPYNLPSILSHATLGMAPKFRWHEDVEATGGLGVKV